MSKNLRRIEIIVIIVLSVLILLSLVFRFNKDEGKKKIQIAPGVYLDEDEENIIDSKTINGIKIDVIGYIYDPNIGGQLTIRITNKKNNTRVLKGLKIKIFDSEKNKLDDLNSTFYVELEKDEFYEFVFDIDIPITEKFIPEYTIIE